MQTQSFLRQSLLVILFGATTTCWSPQVAATDLGDLVFRIATVGSSTIVSHNSPGLQFKMRVVGKITFTDNEDDVQSLTGRAVISEKRDGITRRLDLKPEGANGIARVYSVNGKTQPYDADARKWFAALVPSIVRETATNVDQRVTKLSAKGGTAAVVDEIDRIESSHVRGKYIEVLLKRGPLEDKLLPRLFATIKDVGSDFERKTVLLAVIKQQPATPATQTSLLRIVADMDSSFEQRTVLEALAPTLGTDAGVMQAWYEAVARIDSDFELRSVIESLAKRSVLSPTQLDRAIAVTNRIDSDFEHGSALKALLPHMEKASTPQIEAFLKSARGIDSAFELRSVMNTFVKRVNFEKSAYAAVFQSIDAIDSDFEKRSALETLAKKMPRDAELVARYRKSARTLGQHERTQAEKAIDALNM
jgi:hypothetical protein